MTLNATLVEATAAGVLDEPAADLPVKAVRRRRASKHDFKDGRGRVFAHRHVNGNGWVADTAKVADTVFVNKMAQVYHNAVIEGKVALNRRAQVCGNAYIRDRVIVGDDALVAGKAAIFDDCRILHESRVYGGRVSGSTTMYETSHIRQEAHVHNCTLRSQAHVSGYAMVFMSSLEGAVTITGDAKVACSTMHGFVTIGGRANVISSKLAQQSMYFSSEEATMFGHNKLKVLDFAVVSGVEMLSGLLTIKGRTVIAGGSISFRPNHANGQYERLETETDALFPGVTISRIDQFMAYNVPASQRGRALNHVVPTVRPVNMDELIPTRRLMTMSGDRK
ncbi:MAG: hypothetical protein EBT15_03990 [Betaproteobacteria bacterium]|nr:hypothetical protein [Betaproteobacteria bacterium]